MKKHLDKNGKLSINKFFLLIKNYFMKLQQLQIMYLHPLMFNSLCNDIKL